MVPAREEKRHGTRRTLHGRQGGADGLLRLPARGGRRHNGDARPAAGQPDRQHPVHHGRQAAKVYSPHLRREPVHLIREHYFIW